MEKHHLTNNWFRILNINGRPLWGKKQKMEGFFKAIPTPNYYWQLDFWSVMPECL